MKRIYFAIVISLLVFNTLSLFSQTQWVKLTDKKTNYYGNEYTLFAEKMNPLFLDSKGNIWFFSKSICCYDGNNIKSFDEFKARHVIEIYEDSKGNIWFGSLSGLYKYDVNQKWTHFSKNEVVISYINKIFEDSYGNIWLLHGSSGLTKYDGKDFTYFNHKNGLTTKYVNTITQNSRGDVLIGVGNPFATKLTSNGGVLKYSDDKWSLVKNFPHAIIISNTDVNDNVWFTNAQSMLINKKGIIHKLSGNDWTNYIKKDIGTSIKGISGIFNQIFIDSKNNIWFGTNHYGLILFDGTNWKYFQSDNLIYFGKITSIIENNDNEIWFSFDGFKKQSEQKMSGKDFQGIAKYNSNSFDIIETLPKEQIYKVLEDKNKQKWILTQKGVYYLKK